MKRGGNYSKDKNKIIGNGQTNDINKPSKAELARTSSKKAKYLSTKAFVNQLAVYRLVKEFFTGYLEKDSEYTYGELVDEMHKIYISPTLRTNIYGLLNNLEKVEYEDGSFSQEELREMLKTFQEIVKRLVIEHKSYTPWLTRVANWLFRKNPQKEQDYFSELPVIEDNNRPNINFKIIIEDLYSSLDDGNKRKAVKYYKKAAALYEHMYEEKQKEYYSLLKIAYQKIIEAD